MMQNSSGLRSLLAAGLLLAGAAAAQAEDVGHDQALRLVEQGRILPLAKITTAVRTKVPGKVLEVDLESDDGLYVYELKILRGDGRVQEVEVDARNGRILKIEDDD